MESLTTFLSNPAVLVILGIVGGYVTNRTINRATASKTMVEGITISVEKSLELSNTIMVLHESKNKIENEKAKLERNLYNCLEDCTEIKAYVKEFFESTDGIFQNVNDSIIKRQVEELKKKVLK